MEQRPFDSQRLLQRHLQLLRCHFLRHDPVNAGTVDAYLLEPFLRNAGIVLTDTELEVAKARYGRQRFEWRSFIKDLRTDTKQAPQLVELQRKAVPFQPAASVNRVKPWDHSGKYLSSTLPMPSPVKTAPTPLKLQPSLSASAQSIGTGVSSSSRNLTTPVKRVVVAPKRAAAPVDGLAPLAPLW